MGCINAKVLKSTARVKKYSTAQLPPTIIEKVEEFAFLDYRTLSQTYNISPTIIGTGFYGKVLLGSHKAFPDIKVAIKAIQKKEITSNNHKEKLRNVKDEIQILSRLDHPNICKYYETYESPNFIYAVMEYCSGSDLYTKLAQSTEKRFSE